MALEPTNHSKGQRLGAGKHCILVEKALQLLELLEDTKDDSCGAQTNRHIDVGENQERVYSCRKVNDPIFHSNGAAGTPVWDAQVTLCMMKY